MIRNLTIIFAVYSCISAVRCDAQISDLAAKSDRQIVNIRGELFTTRTNPKSLPLPKEDGAFHFAMFGDRTGGSPSGLSFLRQAVTDTNLMDPDFVMTVGDLIQGYNQPNEWMQQMQEYRDVMSRLQMNWFPVAGNHDIYWDFRDDNRPKIHHEANYEQHFGPLWYSFEHKDCGFIVLYSDEGDIDTGEKGFRDARMQNVSPQQLAFIDKALQQFSACRQVFVFLHHPRWLGRGYTGSNWPDVHQRLVKAGNVTGVFGGHIHQMTFTGPVDGIEYYTLAATGAHLSMDAPNLGYLHHFNIVTVRDDKFTVATVPVGAVIDPQTFDIDFLEDVGIVRELKPSRFGNRLEISQTGAVASNYTIAISNPGKFPIDVAISPRQNGKWQVLPDHQHIIVPPGKSEGMRFYFFRRPEPELGWANFELPEFTMNVDYLHTSARIRIPEKMFPVDIGIVKSGVSFDQDLENCLVLRGVQSKPPRRSISKFPNDSVRIKASDAALPQGPFTIEAWVKPSKTDKSRAIIAKTQSSEYALFLHNGRTQFDVHIAGRYVAPAAKEKLPIGKWSHVAGVYDGQEARLYIDGRRISSLPASGQRTLNDLPLYIGADPDDFGNPTREFAGQLDEVRISKNVRYTNDFQPSRRFERDPEALLLLHLDRSFGPFLVNDSANETSAIKTGQATISNRN